MNIEHLLAGLRDIFPNHTDESLLRSLELNCLDFEATVNSLLSSKTDQQTAQELQDRMYAEEVDRKLSDHSENMQEEYLTVPFGQKLAELGSVTKERMKRVYQRIFQQKPTERKENARKYSDSSQELFCIDETESNSQLHGETTK